MKKFWLILIACIIIFSLSSAFCEEVILRNDIRFGDSLAEVKAKETLEIKSETADELRTGSGVLAGVDVKSVIYRFEDGKLVSVLWDVLNSRNDIFPPLIFDDLQSALTAKYGTPDSTDTNSFFLIHGAAIDEMLDLASEDLAFTMMMIWGEAGPIKQCEWQIDSHHNENVKIDLLYYKVAEEDFRIRLSFDVYTDEQLEQMIQLDKEGNNSIQNDL